MNDLSTDVGDEPVASSKIAEAWQRWGKVTLVGVLLLALPAWWLWGTVSQARESSRRSSCNCHLKQFGLAMHNYHQEYGSFPPAFVLGPDGRKWHSWRVLILPYLEQRPLYDEYRFDEPWDGPNNRKLLTKMPQIFACPSRPCEAQPSALLAIGVLACNDRPGPSVANGFTSYAAVLGQDCSFRGAQLVSLKEITDGSTNTLLIGESTRTKIPWTKPDDIDTAFHSTLGDPAGFSGQHGEGVMFLFVDGHVKFVSTTTSQATIDALFTRNGDELIQGF